MQLLVDTGVHWLGSRIEQDRSRASDRSQPHNIHNIEFENKKRKYIMSNGKRYYTRVGIASYIAFHTSLLGRAKQVSTT